MSFVSMLTQWIPSCSKSSCKGNRPSHGSQAFCSVIPLTVRRFEFTDEIRVIPYKGVDGVIFGDSYDKVISILGEPEARGYESGPDI